MHLELTLPNCPICNSIPVSFHHNPKSQGLGPMQEIEFECSAGYCRSAKPDFNSDYKPYGPWSAWKCNVQCSKATEIALALLAKQGGEHA